MQSSCWWWSWHVPRNSGDGSIGLSEFEWKDWAVWEKLCDSKLTISPHQESEVIRIAFGGESVKIQKVYWWQH